MLSIVIPHYHEHPQLIFTLQCLLNSLEGSIIEAQEDYEIILIDNAPAPQHEHRELDSRKYIQMKQDAGMLPKIKSMAYTACVSHWQAKNFGCNFSNPEGTFLFLDAHIIIKEDVLDKMWTEFKNLPELSTLHLPICYILEPDTSHALAYKLVHDLDNGILDYKFMKWENNEITEVPCMSTCGMMISKDTFFNVYEGWPSSLGNYSGGEHFINFVGGLLGVKKYVSSAGAIHHYAAPRAYNINYNDVYRNRAIAMYLVGGESFLAKYLDHLRTLTVGKISPRMINKLQVELPNIPELRERRNHIESNSVVTLENWISYWNI